MTIASRTPEGHPARCPVCGVPVCLEPSDPPGDAPCPNCGTLLWFVHTSDGGRCYEADVVAPKWERLIEILNARLKLQKETLSPELVLAETGLDSLDQVELVMELEELGLSIPDHAVEKIRTLGDLLDYLMQQGKE